MMLKVYDPQRISKRIFLLPRRDGGWKGGQVFRQPVGKAAEYIKAKQLGK
jgi:hypothetical protein